MEDNGKTQEIASIERLVGLFAFLLLYVTTPLWGAGGTEISPQIPWFEALCLTPQFIDTLFLVTLSLSSALLLFVSANAPFRRENLIVFFLSLTGLLLLDQHRLQPWALQFFLFSFVLAISHNVCGLKCCRILVIIIYVYSAISKFDLSFLDGPGQMLLDGLKKPLQIDISMWSQKAKQTLAAIFPVGELLIAMLLTSQRFRRLGLWASILMHVLILFAVGPFGLNHEQGVLIWNVYFILQNLILFRKPTENSNPENLSLPRSSWLAYGITALFAILPALENWGWYDHWPAWAVYSSRPERVEVLVEESAVKSLPAPIQDLCGSPTLLDDRSPVLLDRWAFQTRHCPIYPQARYRVALANALLRDHVRGESITIRISSTPNRFTGKRETKTYHGWAEIDQLLDEYRLNTQPRVTQ